MVDLNSLDLLKYHIPPVSGIKFEQFTLKTAVWIFQILKIKSWKRGQNVLNYYVIIIKEQKALYGFNTLKIENIDVVSYFYKLIPD